MEVESLTSESQTEFDGEEQGVIDYRLYTLRGDEPPSTHELHFRMAREHLENCVAPYVSSERTNEVFEFKGEQSYLKAQTPLGTTQEVVALQCLYQLEAARQAGDVDKVIQLASAYNYHFEEIRRRWQWGMGQHEAQRALWRYHNGRRETKQGKTKLRDVPDIILQAAYAKHRGAKKRNWMQCVINDVVAYTGQSVTRKTVKDELRIRGISE